MSNNWYADDRVVNALADIHTENNKLLHQLAEAKDKLRESAKREGYLEARIEELEFELLHAKQEST